jgi:hypothetical protein
MQSWVELSRLFGDRSGERISSGGRAEWSFLFPVEVV